MITRCGIYTRTAIQDQDVSEKLKAAERYIESQDNAWVATHYHDNGYSGANMVRPDLLRMMRHVEDGKLNAIIVTSITDITRSTRDFVEICNILSQHNVKLITLNGNGNQETALGKLVLAMLVTFAEYERSLKEIEDEAA